MPNDKWHRAEHYRSRLNTDPVSKQPLFTTAADTFLPPFRKRFVLQATITVYAILWGYLAIAPVSRTDWVLENLLVILSLLALARWLYRHPLSDTACLAAALFLALHAIGAHFTYSKVPTGFWLQDLLQIERNHFDRLAHFAFGLLCQYPFREAFFRHMPASSGMSAFLAFACVTSAGAIYEIIEWLAASILSPDAAMTFLGTQGDMFDAQKDSALGIAGATVGLLITRRHFRAAG